MMATVTAFDKINQLGKYHFDFEEYFSEMSITEEQKKKRQALAEDLIDEVLFLFAMYLAALEYGIAVEKARAQKEYEDRVRAALEKAKISEDIIKAYLLVMAMEEADVTHKRYKDNPYWTSEERAITIAENDANIIYDNQEYAEAKANGATMKQWITMKDERVRATHVAVDDEIIPIDEYFVVGDSLMQFPHDLNGSPEETVNCRCVCSYF